MSHISKYKFSCVYDPANYDLIENLNKVSDVLILDKKKCSTSLDISPIVENFGEFSFSVDNVDRVFKQVRSCSLNWLFLDPMREENFFYGWKLNPVFTFLKKGIIESVGGFCRDYTLRGAYADLGFRLVRSGYLIRIISQGSFKCKIGEKYSSFKSIMDSCLFVRRNLSNVNLWLFILFNPLAFFKLFDKVSKISLQVSEGILFAKRVKHISKYSAIIPTVDRYEYLEKAIDSLLKNSLPPEEIVVVDQTPLVRRNTAFYDQFPQNIVRVIFLDNPGQATARNVAVAACKEDWILFFDDDSEAWPEMIVEHVALLEHSLADVSTGISLAPWKDRTYIDESISYVRVSEVLDTGNAMISRKAFEAVGGLKLAFNRGSGVDDNLGRRLYLSGFLILFNPMAIRTHHKAKSGGLRMHGAWWTGKTLWWRELPLATHTYNILCFYEKKYWLALLLYSYMRSFKRNSSFGRAINIFLLPYKLFLSFVKGMALYFKFGK